MQKKGAAEDEIVGWHHPFNGHGLGQTPGDGKGQRPGVQQPRGHKSQTRLGD